MQNIEKGVSIWDGLANQKKKKKKTETKTKSFTDCPVCKEKKFTQVTTYVYEDELKEFGELKIDSEEVADCSRFTGNQTGYCEQCGGVVHGWIFSTPSEGLNAYTIQMFNFAFLCSVQQMNENINNGVHKTRFDSIAQFINDLKSQSIGKMGDFAVGYYLLLMYLSNDVIGFNDSTQFTLLSHVKESGATIVHDQMKDLMQKSLPQFFK